MGLGIEVNYSGFACNNGLDDDGDGFIDSNDVGCAIASDINEIDPSTFCSNGIDDDGDLGQILMILLYQSNFEITDDMVVMILE